MRRAAILFVLIVFMFSAVAVFAQDSANGTDDEANWCYDPDVWGDGRCGDEDLWVRAWFWACGWYGGNIDAGYIPGPGPVWCPASVEEALSIGAPITDPPTTPDASADLALVEVGVSGIPTSLSLSSPQGVVIPILTYSFNIVNNGPDTATGVMVSGSVSISGCADAKTVPGPGSMGTMNSGASIPASFTFEADCTVSGSLTISGNESDPNSGNNTLPISYGPTD